DPLGRDFGNAGVGRDDGRPVGLLRHAAVGGIAGAEVRWQRDVEALRVREREIFEVADEVFFAHGAADARVVAAFFADRARGAALVVVGAGGTLRASRRTRDTP